MTSQTASSAGPGSATPPLVRRLQGRIHDSNPQPITGPNALVALPTAHAEQHYDPLQAAVPLPCQMER